MSALVCCGRDHVSKQTHLKEKALENVFSDFSQNIPPGLSDSDLKTSQAWHSQVETVIEQVNEINAEYKTLHDELKVNVDSGLGVNKRIVIATAIMVLGFVIIEGASVAEEISEDKLIHHIAIVSRFAGGVLVAFGTGWLAKIGLDEYKNRMISDSINEGKVRSEQLAAMLENYIDIKTNNDSKTIDALDKKISTCLNRFNDFETYINTKNKRPTTAGNSAIRESDALTPFERIVSDFVTVLPEGDQIKNSWKDLDKAPVERDLVNESGTRTFILNSDRLILKNPVSGSADWGSDTPIVPPSSPASPREEWGNMEGQGVGLFPDIEIKEVLEPMEAPLPHLLGMIADRWKIQGNISGLYHNKNIYIANS